MGRVFTWLPEREQFNVYKDKIHYTITIRIKDGKFKYRLDNFIHSYPSTQNAFAYTDVVDHEFKLNDYNPDKHKDKKNKERILGQLNPVHLTMTKEIRYLKKAIEISVNEKW